MNIVLLSNGFVSWGGGIDFFKHCTYALINQKDANNLNWYILIPDDKKITSVKKQLYNLKNVIKEVFNKRCVSSNRMDSISTQVIIDSFKCFEEKMEIIFYRNSKQGLLDTLKKINADVVIPSFESLGKDFPYRWVGYLYDFQHKYYPGFFTKREINDRNRAFSKMLLDAQTVVVNSKAVKQDIFKYYPDTITKIIALPFAPVVQARWFQFDDTLLAKYKLPEKYFIISNQFWVHKSHITAFEALAILQNAGFDDCKIVCTGNTFDYRFPGYFNKLQEQIMKLGLNKKIQFLGYIPKDDQIQIMRKSIAVLQPTLFEGGPGGGSVYDAVAFGIPVVVSDIPVNREILEDNIFFFKAKSAEDMANKMKEVIDKDKKNELRKPTTEELLIRSNKRLEMLGDRLRYAIDSAINAKQ